MYFIYSAFHGPGNSPDTRVRIPATPNAQQTRFFSFRVFEVGSFNDSFCIFMTYRKVLKAIGSWWTDKTVIFVWSASKDTHDYRSVLKPLCP